jgi:hypothetical protein
VPVAIDPKRNSGSVDPAVDALRSEHHDPVTTAARQENSGKSFRILMAIGAPLCSTILAAHPNTLTKK